LNELWLCLDRQFAYAVCKTNQGGGIALSRPLKIWRGGK
jgi:ribonuclease T2